MALSVMGVVVKMLQMVTSVVSVMVTIVVTTVMRVRMTTVMTSMGSVMTSMGSVMTTMMRVMMTTMARMMTTVMRVGMTTVMTIFRIVLVLLVSHEFVETHSLLVGFLLEFLEVFGLHHGNEGVNVHAFLVGFVLPLAVLVLVLFGLVGGVHAHSGHPRASQASSSMTMAGTMGISVMTSMTMSLPVTTMG